MSSFFLEKMRKEKFLIKSYLPVSDIVMGIEKRLEFYYNGTLKHTEDIPSAKNIKSTTYDPVHYRVIFADIIIITPSVSISSFDLSTRKIQHLVTRTTTSESVSVAYDPVTQLLFWKSGYYRIYSFPLNPASSNKAVENLIVSTKHYCLDIAVDSCGGYVTISDIIIHTLAKLQENKKKIGNQFVDHFSVVFT